MVGRYHATYCISKDFDIFQNNDLSECAYNSGNVCDGGGNVRDSGDRMSIRFLPFKDNFLISISIP